VVICVQRSILIRNLKIAVVLALIIGLLGAVLFLIYGFTIVWQAMAATIVTIFLSIITILFIIASIYLWIKNLLLKKEVNRYQKELQMLKSKLQKCESESNKNEKIK